MKTKRINASPSSETDENSVLLSLDQSAMDLIMDRLTNLYSRAVHAALRESLSNALDSHIEAGTKTPVKLTLPSSYTTQTPLFDKNITDSGHFIIVEDFGTGMDREDMLRIYARYGASTKRENNKQRGGFGFGAKSPLAISDTFYVVSAKNGIENVAKIGKNESGHAYLKIMETHTVDTANYFKVVIPVTKEMVVKDLSQQILKNDEFFIGMSKEELQINFAGQDFPHDFANVHSDEFIQMFNFSGKPLSWMKKNDLGDAVTHRTLGALIGGIRYNLTLENKDLGDTNSLQRLKKYAHDIYLNVPIGSVDLTPSREDLIYSPRTWETLTNLADQVVPQIESHVALKFRLAETRKEVALAFNAEREKNFWNTSNIVWRGEKIPAAISFSSVGVIYKKKTSNKKWELEQSNQYQSHTYKAWYTTKHNYMIRLEEGETARSVFDQVKLSLNLLTTEDNSSYDYNRSERNVRLLLLKNHVTLDPWIEGGLKVFTVEQFKAEASKVRKARRVAAQAKKAASSSDLSLIPESAVKTERRYFMLDLKNDVVINESTLKATYTMNAVVAADIKDEKVFYIFGGDKSVSPMLRNLIPPISPSISPSHRGVDGSVVRLLKLLYPEGKIVFLNGTYSLKKMLELLPEAKDLTEGIKADVAAYVSKHEKEIIATKLKFSLNSTEFFNIRKFTEIVSKSMGSKVLPEGFKDFVTHVDANKISSEGVAGDKMLSVFVNFIPAVVSEFNTKSAEKLSSFYEMSKNYPLLAKTSYVMVKDHWEDLLLYVKTVDSKTKK